jgi:SPP1 gp7 family putative phage head morphogenesis protein
MTNRTDYILKWHRFQQRHEAIYTTEFKKALRINIAQWERNQNVMDVTAEPIYKVLLRLYKTVGPLWAARTGVHIVAREQKALMPMGFSERIVELMRQYYGLDLLNDAEQITSYTREVIVRVLSEAAQSGSSFDQIVKLLTSNSELSTMRARRIARTETVTAANSAAYLNAKESGLLMRKEWLAVHDNRTRHSHKEVDGVTVNIDDYFTVGGAKMLTPGARVQENGLEVPAKETVNCRCTQGFIPVRRNGKLVRV